MRGNWPGLTTAVAACLLLAACGRSTPQAQPEPSPGVPSTSRAAVTIEVSAGEPVRLDLPGVATLTGSAGTFIGPGQLRVTPVEVASPLVGVRAAGLGVDVDVVGTELVGPLQVTFPVAQGGDEDDIPVVLHRSDDGMWEPQPAEQTAGGIVIDTAEFSLRVPAWLDPRTWFADVLDSAVDALTSRTDAPACAGGGPEWASLQNATSLLHSCLIRNEERGGGAVRAEAQLAPNRRFYVWVRLPSGADYTWVQDQPKAMRAGLGRALGFDSDERVLLDGGTTVTAGFLQPAASQTVTFTGYIDHTSMVMSVLAGVLGLTSADPKHAVPALLLLTAQCSGEIPSSPRDTAGGYGFIRCGAQTALENLTNPDKALAASVEHFGEVSYSKEAEPALISTKNRLELLGKVLKVASIAGLARDVWAQIPDAFAQVGADRPGDVELALRGKPSPAVLGVADLMGPYGEGWGTARPSIISNGGVPSGVASDITWSDWGSPDAFGEGLTSLYLPEGGYYSEPGQIQLRASELGTCYEGGPPTYRRLLARVPEVPGGPLGDWFEWSAGGGDDLCDPM